MGQLTFEVIKKSCVFVLQMREPEETLKKLAMFFQDRHIVMDNLCMHRYQSGVAMLISHCQIEKDRIGRTVQLMGNLPGIMEIEKMEGK